MLRICNLMEMALKMKCQQQKRSPKSVTKDVTQFDDHYAQCNVYIEIHTFQWFQYLPNRTEGTTLKCCKYLLTFYWVVKFNIFLCENGMQCTKWFGLNSEMWQAITYEIFKWRIIDKLSLFLSPSFWATDSYQSSTILFRWDGFRFSYKMKQLNVNDWLSNNNFNQMNVWL